jgi:hypothetical protein
VAAVVAAVLLAEVLPVVEVQVMVALVVRERLGP